jgi:hypothetical protein
MVLFAAIGLALLVMIFTIAVRPTAVLAANGQGPAPPPTTHEQPGLSPRNPARAGSEKGTAAIPKLGKASNRYDMEALRNFDAGSHR